MMWWVIRLLESTCLRALEPVASLQRKLHVNLSLKDSALLPT